MLTPTQLTALKSDILADSNFDNVTNDSDGNSAIAAAYNLTASPDYWVWKTFVPDSEIYETTTGDGTTWSWTTFIARTQGERDAWRQMVNMKGGINASLVSVRTGIADIFSGAPGATQRTHLLTISRRKATRVEKLLATGAGTIAAPSLLSFEGDVTYEDVDQARNS